LTAPAPGHTLATIGQVPAGSGWPRPCPGQSGRAKATAGRTQAQPSCARPHRGSPDLATKKWSCGDSNPQPCCSKTDEPGRAKATAGRTQAQPGCTRPHRGSPDLATKKWSCGDSNPQPCCSKTDELPLSHVLFYD
jgi:hypothetical protein